MISYSMNELIYEIMISRMKKEEYEDITPITLIYHYRII